MRITLKYMTTILITTIMTLAISACGKISEPTPTVEQKGHLPQNGQTIKVNIGLNGGLSALAIAKDKGWLEEEFKKLNAEVVWSQFQSGPPLLESLVSSRVDLSFLGDGATLSGISNKVPFHVIALLGEGDGLNSILIPVNSTAQKLEDLKGKTIGLAKGTTAHVYLTKLLENYGLSIGDINIINLQPEDALAAFESGKLDAWVTWAPYSIHLLELQKAKEIKVKETILAPASMIGREEFIKAHPELVITFLKVYKKTIEWMHKHPDESAEFFSKQSKMSPDIVKKVLNASGLDIRAYSKDALDAQQLTADILFENGFLKNRINFKGAVDDSFVNEALK